MRRFPGRPSGTAPSPRRRFGSGDNCGAGCLIGVAENCPDLYEITISLAPGETIIFYTDGVTEAAEKGTGPLFGTDRLIEVTRRIGAQAPLREYTQTLRAEIDRFC